MLYLMPGLVFLQACIGIAASMVLQLGWSIQSALSMCWVQGNFRELHPSVTHSNWWWLFSTLQPTSCTLFLHFYSGFPWDDFPLLVTVAAKVNQSLQGFSIAFVFHLFQQDLDNICKVTRSYYSTVTSLTLTKYCYIICYMM